jgi:tRNA(fMet)-specific endonuclease VapC
VSYLLDTNTIIALIEGRQARVRQVLKYRAPMHELLVPSIAAFELWYGVAKSRDRERNQREVALFLSRTQVVAFEPEDARIAGEIRAQLVKQGTPIGPYDILIAAQAVRRDATLVTSNVREFGRVERLMIEDWAAPEAGS